jgi:hypothetical protein
MAARPVLARARAGSRRATFADALATAARLTLATGTLVSACTTRHVEMPSGPPANVELTLYRDVAVVRQRVRVEASAAGSAHATITVAGDVSTDDIVVDDPGLLAHVTLHDAAVGASEAARRLAIDADAPRAGSFTVVLDYATERLPWEASYTWVTGPDRLRATLDGELVVHDRAGIAWQGADVFVVDGLRSGLAEDAVSREIGRADINGDVRLPLVHGGRAIPMRPVLVFDPIGASVERPRTIPSDDPQLGIHPTDAPLIESYELDREPEIVRGLPAGDARLVERHRDGAPAVLGETRMFEPKAHMRTCDTIAVGTAGDVRAKRERQDFSIDDDNRRIVEEFSITFDNARARPVNVIAREHMVRGLNWHLAYYTAAEASQETTQQVALRAQVPAHGRTKIDYVVVYTWDGSR